MTKYRLEITSDNKELLICLMHVIKKTDSDSYLWKIENGEITPIAYQDTTGFHIKEEGADQ